MPLAETQANWIARLIAGTCRLPDRETMMRSTRKEAARNRRRYTHPIRHTLQVDFYPYKRSIEREVRIYAL